MALSADQRYYLKRKALYYYYEKNCSNTDIAKMLGISRVTLNRLLAEAKEEGMVKIEIIDTRNISHIPVSYTHLSPWDSSIRKCNEFRIFSVKKTRLDMCIFNNCAFIIKLILNKCVLHEARR